MKHAGAYTLRARVLLLIAVAFVPAYAVLLYFAYEQTRLARLAADSHALELVSSLAVESERLAGATHLLIRSLSEIADFRSDSPRCLAVAGSFLVALPQYLAVGAVWSDGIIRCFASMPPTAATPPTEGDIRAALRAAAEPTGPVGEVSYGGMLHLNGGAVPVEVYRMELMPNPNGRAALIALVDLRWIQGFLFQVGRGTERSLMVFDATGRLVLSGGAPNPARVALGELPNGVSFELGDSARIVTVVSATGEPSRFAAAALRSDTSAGTILLGISEDPLLVAAEEAYGWTVAVLAIVGGLVLGAGLVGGSVLVQRPMDRLLAATRRIAMGDLETRIGRIEDAGEIGQLSAAFDEMTAALADERRRADQARRLAEHASQAKSEFLAVMSHELKTPLASIISFAELLESGIGGPITEEQREHLHRITESGWHLSDLVNEVLEFSRLDAGREAVRSESTNITALLAEMTALLGPSAAQRSLTLTVRMPDEPVVAETDPAKLRQIVLNLLSNAIKFTEEGEITIALEAGERAIRIAVEDTGVGIAPEHREHVFEPFWQVESALTRTKGGAGLGLSIVDQLTRLLGGRVEVESELGRGSRFTVVLPLYRDADAPSGEPAALS